MDEADARRALAICRSTLRGYAEQHEAKVTRGGLTVEKTRETLEKAVVNLSLVQMLDDVLSGETDVRWPPERTG